MRVRFSGDERIYVDGIHPVDFQAGQEAEIPERIAAGLLVEGRATLPDEAKAILTGAPENKAGLLGGRGRVTGRSKKR